MGNFKETVSSRSSRAHEYMNSQRLWQHTQSLYGEEKGTWTQLPALIKTLSATGTLAKETQFSLAESRWVY